MLRARGRAVALLALCAAVAACGRGAPKSPPRPPAQVVVEPAQERAVPVELRAIGTVVPVATIAVRSHVSGTLERVFFQEGQEVRRGELLFRIDPRPYEAALAQARANLARDEAQLRNALVERARYRQLAQQKLVARSDYDTRATQAAALEATVRADRAAVNSAQVDLEYTGIRSPIAGRTGNLQVNQGNLVKADDATPLVTVRQLRPIDVGFSIPAPSLDEVRRRAAMGPLDVLASGPGVPRVERGELFFVDSTVDAATGTVLCKARFPNQDTGLWPGEYVDVRVVLRTLPDAVVVESRAVEPSQSGPEVFVVKDGLAELRHVETGPRLGDLIVVERGVAPGEQVVVDGMLGLAAGVKVQARAEQPPGRPGGQPASAPGPAPGPAQARDGTGRRQ